MSASSKRWKPRLKLAAFRPVLRVRAVRAVRTSLRSCVDAEHHPRRLLNTPGRRAYSFGTEARRGCSVLLHHQLFRPRNGAGLLERASCP